MSSTQSGKDLHSGWFLQRVEVLHKVSVIYNSIHGVHNVDNAQLRMISLYDGAHCLHNLGCSPFTE
jgi:hypothetical protein